MNAEILAVGTELLIGQIANTNAQYITRRLPDIGVNVYYHSVVGDNPGRLKECLNIALKRSDAVVMTGGLGPTQDDLTKETVAEIMGRKLALHEESYNRIKAFFERLNRPMVNSNIKQAYLPENSIVINNNKGTAPGCIIESDNKIVIMLPGPPSEMKPMFEDSVIPYFEKKSQYRIVSKYIKIFGIGESAVEDRLIDIIEEQTNPTIAPYVREGEVTLRITAKCANDENAENLIAPVLTEIRNRLGNAVYSTEDKNMEEVTAALLMEKTITISIAESCTGGLVAGRLTTCPGISRVFNRGIVSYSNESKIECLGVKPETLRKYGAVSGKTAEEMARGIRESAKTDLGLSVTGIAGPDGATREKPVGLVYIALADAENVRCKELKLTGDRDRIRSVASLHALDMVRRYALSMEL